jgi:hypothetical protein
MRFGMGASSSRMNSISRHASLPCMARVRLIRQRRGSQLRFIARGEGSDARLFGIGENDHDALLPGQRCPERPRAGTIVQAYRAALETQ